MTPQEYLEFTRTTAIYPKENALGYLALGLTSEAGEVAGKLKKVIRDSNNVLTDEKREAIFAEVSDVLWYMVRLTDELGYTFDDLIEYNTQKLSSRKERGTLGGSGDVR
jgi:NTP pyrophosphatase (non-canonical NTP hydrolase)